MPIPLIILFIAIAVFIIFYLVANIFFNVGIPRSSNYFRNSGKPKENSVWREAEAGISPPDERELAAMSEGAREFERLYGNERREAVRFITEKKPERVYIKSHDQLSLCAHFIEAPESKATILMVHGYRSHGLMDFALAVPYYYRAGCSCLIIDQRSHEESEGKYICYGTKEKYDVKAWAEYLASRFPGRPIIFDGVSMGAATVMLASGLKLPSEVRGIIADCGFTSPADIFSAVLKRTYRISPMLVLPFAGLLVRIRAGFDISGSESETKEALRKNRLPMLIAHGEADDFVPYQMGKENYETAKQYCDAEFLSVTGARHAFSFLIEREKYLEAINRLFKKCGIDAEIEPYKTA